MIPRQFRYHRGTGPQRSSGSGRGVTTYNLEFDTLTIELNSPDLKIDADSRNERRCPGIVTES